MKRTNRIAAFQNVTETGSEGGQRPSERTLHRTTDFDETFQESSSHLGEIDDPFFQKN